MYLSNINSTSIKIHSIQTEIITSKESITINSEDNVTILCIIKGEADYELPMKEGKANKVLS